MPAEPGGSSLADGSPKPSSRGANTFFMLAGQFFGKGALFLSVMLLSRFLSDADFGALLFALVLGQVYLLLSDMGVSLVLNMRVSTRPGDTRDLLSTSFRLRIMTASAGFPLLIITGIALGMSWQRLVLLILIGLSFFFESFAEMFYSIFRAREKMVYESASRIVMAITGLAAVLLMIRMRTGVNVIAAAYVLRSMTAAGVSLFFLGRMGLKVGGAPGFQKMRSLFLASLPLGIMGLMIVVHQRADNVVLRQLLGENAVAAWQECIRLVEIMLLLVVPTLLPGALFPALCRSFGSDAYKRETGDMARTFTALAAALSLGVIATGTRLLELLWGASYLRQFDAWELQLCLYLSLGGLAALYLMNVLVSSLMALNKVKVVIPVSAGAVLTVIVGNLVLIPRIGLPSVGILYLASNLLVLLAYWLFLRWRGYSLPVWRESGISVALALPAAIIAFIMRDMPFVPAFAVPIVIYAILWLATGGYGALVRLFPLRRTDSP